MLREIQKLRILKAIVGLSKDPENTDNVFFIGDTMLGMLSPEEVKEHSATVLAYSGFKDLYEERYSPAIYDVKTLSLYPENSLAYSYGVFMRKHGYSSEWYPIKEASNALYYMRNRLLQTHDIIHTITGFDGSNFGEIGVQAFYLGQMPDQPLPCAIMSAGFLRALEKPAADRMKLMEVINSGYEMGKAAQPVLFRKWEDDWNTDIVTLREELAIRP